MKVRLKNPILGKAYALGGHYVYYGGVDNEFVIGDDEGFDENYFEELKDKTKKVSK